MAILDSFHQRFEDVGIRLTVTEHGDSSSPRGGRSLSLVILIADSVGVFCW